MRRAEIEYTNYYTRYPCIICGGSTDKDAVWVLLAGGGAVCDDCIAAGSDRAGPRLVAHAQSLEKAAEGLRRLAAEGVELPSFQEVNEARRLHEKDGL